MIIVGVGVNFFPKMLTVDSLNLMFQIKSLETNKWAAYWVANLHNLRDVGQSSWVATDTFPVQRDTYYQTSFRWRNIWALGRMDSFLRARSGHRMAQKPYKDSGNHKLRPDKDPDLVGVYKITFDISLSSMKQQQQSETYSLHKCLIVQIYLGLYLFLTHSFFGKFILCVIQLTLTKSYKHNTTSQI